MSFDIPHLTLQEILEQLREKVRGYPPPRKFTKEEIEELKREYDPNVTEKWRELRQWEETLRLWNNKNPLEPLPPLPKRFP